jgi:hypothetical protein
MRSVAARRSDLLDRFLRSFASLALCRVCKSLSASSLFSGEGRTPHFHKIVRTRLKMKDLIFALPEKSEARVRKVLKGKGILFRWCARAERTALGERKVDLFCRRAMRWDVGRRGEWEDGMPTALAGRVWRGRAGADGAKISLEHKLL